MPPLLAVLLWLILLLALLWFDPAKEQGTSLALWLPVIWMFIIASRLPSQWLGGQMGQAAQALEEGNPLDRVIYLVFIMFALGILISRSFNWSQFFAHNLFLMVFLFFALLSVVWSDFPLVAFKRWFRDLGNYLMILIVLTDPCPLEAVRNVLRRLAYLLIPLSILLNKYFPLLSRQYDQWTGVGMFTGATTSKNMLGALCLVSAIFFFWDTVTRWPERKKMRTKRVLLVNAAFAGMTLWLLNLSNSATSRVCLALGCLVIWAVQSQWGRRHSRFIQVMIPASFCLYLILAFGLDLNGELASHVGRDPTLTDRTLIWKTVLSLHTNPLVGTGYESFWLGPRLERVWEVLAGINEAHNGYLEIYLNLGSIGLVLLVVFLMASYRATCKRITASSALATLGLALWTIMLFYDMTESAFRGGLLWFTFLLAAIEVVDHADEVEHSVVKSRNTLSSARFQRLPVETAGQRR